jgi:hypothetical protein
MNIIIPIELSLPRAAQRTNHFAYANYVLLYRLHSAMMSCEAFRTVARSDVGVPTELRGPRVRVVVGVCVSNKRELQVLYLQVTHYSVI